MRLEIFGYVLIIKSVALAEADVREELANKLKASYTAGFLDKVQAVKRVRELFLSSMPFDERGTLKGALDFIQK